MQVKATLNNLRMTPRKVRLVTSLVAGMDAKAAQSQLRFMNKKAADIILRLLNSGLANAKHNFNLDENNFYILRLEVEAGPSLKRWLPRAMGRATPILKRTCSINLILEEKTPSKQPEKGAKKKAKEQKKEQKLEKETVVEEKPMIEKEETISVVSEPAQEQRKPAFVAKPYGASEQSKKRFFSRQTFGNIKKVFRRKSI
jgi:large subunit ribosomal protein L22